MIAKKKIKMIIKNKKLQTKISKNGNPKINRIKKKQDKSYLFFLSLIDKKNINDIKTIKGINVILDNFSFHKQGNRNEKIYQKIEEPWDYSKRAAEILRHEYIVNCFKRISEHLNKKLRILDLGCSLGHITSKLYPYAEFIIANDISYTAVEKAKKLCESHPGVKKNLYYFSVSDSMNLPFKEDIFDVILVSDGLREWFDDNFEFQKIVVRKIYRTLKYGGYGIFTDYLSYKDYPKLFEAIHSSPFRHFEEIALYDRLWYRMETWLRPFKRMKLIQRVLINKQIAIILSKISKSLGKRYSKHLGVIAIK